MAFSILPRDEQYFVLFQDAAQNMTESARALEDLVRNFTDVEKKADRIRALEARGDEITFQIISRLRRAFVTPFEREDIIAIGRAMDDVVDMIEASAARLASYAVERPTEGACAFAGMIVSASLEIEKIMAQLHRRKVDEIRLPKMAVNQVEAEADGLLRRLVAGLFTGGADPLTVIKWKEIYETLETVTDAQERLANLVEGIILKNA
ncbi:DUF47 domain-containing protein [Symbiobacterium terraclitae]|uniref:DUF47 domain-containing protein n=1 Tax=Symbiobacterium terraclitae TaxID=557451 RepID=UPI0035B54FED